MATDGEALTWVYPGHYYSPIVNPDDQFVASMMANFDSLELPVGAGIDLDQGRMSDFFIKLAARYGDLPFVPSKEEGTITTTRTVGTATATQSRSD